MKNKVEKTRRSILWGIVLNIVVIIGCGNTTKIGKLLNDADKYCDQYCEIKGFVTTTLDVPLLNHDIFKVDDRSGAIWVYTTKGSLPDDDTEGRVKGTFKKGLKIPAIKFEAEYYIELWEWE